TDAAKGLPELWRGDALDRPQKKALLRCLIDKVVIHRSATDAVHVRIVWRGTDTTSFDVPLAVASVARLWCGEEMDRLTVELFGQGRSDEEIAEELTCRGYRSPRETKVIPTTVRTIRRRHGLRRPIPGSAPRRALGMLTIPQVAASLGVPLH